MTGDPRHHAPPERVGKELRRMNLTAMDPETRKQLRVHCENVILRSLLPGQPTERELADAKDLLATIEDIEHPAPIAAGGRDPEENPDA